MMIRSMTVAFFGLALGACQQTPDTITAEDVSTYASAMAEAEPASMRLENSCMLRTPDTTFAAALEQDVFEGHYLYLKQTGRDNGFIVEFDDTCRALKRGRAPRLEDTCRRDWIRIGGQLCVVKDIYQVPNEAVGRALALKIQGARTTASLR